MQSEDLIQSIKDNLNARPGQAIVLGVCSTLAKRSNQEVWIYRAAAIVLGVFFTFPTLAAYILLGLFLDETSERTRGVFQGLFISIREFVDKGMEAGRGLFSEPRRH